MTDKRGRKAPRTRLALLLLAAIAAYPAEASATWPGKAGLIAYDALSAPEDGLYKIRPDGTRSRRVIGGSIGDIAWSRDGKRIAYLTGNGEELWEARSDGSQARLILRLETGVGFDPAWSPSGRQLVFTHHRGFEGDFENVPSSFTEDIYIINRDGKGLRKLRRGHDPTWSSRNRIAYTNTRGDVFTIRPDGRKRLTYVRQPKPARVTELDYSPDGLKLVYWQSAPSTANRTLRTIDLRTGARTSFGASTRRVNTLDVAWAPGGRRLAYLHSSPVSRGPSPPYELRTIHPNGTRPRTLFKFPAGSIFNFAWQTR